MRQKAAELQTREDKITKLEDELRHKINEAAK